MNRNETRYEGMNWFQLAQSGLLWKAVALNTVMVLRVPYKDGILWLAVAVIFL
jgi:hypothetical protein